MGAAGLYVTALAFDPASRTLSIRPTPQLAAPRPLNLAPAAPRLSSGRADRHLAFNPRTARCGRPHDNGFSRWSAFRPLPRVAPGPHPALRQGPVRPGHRTGRIDPHRVDVDLSGSERLVKLAIARPQADRPA